MPRFILPIVISLVLSGCFPLAAGGGKDTDTGTSDSAVAETGNPVDSAVAETDDSGGSDSGGDDTGPTDADDTGPTDADGDGSTTDADCDDADPSIYPGAPETCDGVDENCNGGIDEGAADASAWYADADGDGYGNAGDATVACAPPDGFIDNAEDCDDSDLAINPGATEVCDAADTDEDCDGLSDDYDTDVDRSVGGMIVYMDYDGDGYGNVDSSQLTCDDAAGWTTTIGDCYDGNAAINPGAAELCNGRDDDCDGSVDENTATDAKTWYADTDGDGYGDEDDTEVACDEPSGYAAESGDCDDSDAEIYPGASSAYMQVGVDWDCDGGVWCPEDTDGDGYAGETGYERWPYVESSDATCGNDPDEGSTSAPFTDCDDTDDSVNPGADELCNEIDDDCDGSVDEAGADDEKTWYADTDGDGYGDATDSTLSCDTPSGYVADDTDCDDGDDDVHPGTEDCEDSENNDCDGYESDETDPDCETSGGTADCTAPTFVVVDSTVGVASGDPGAVIMEINYCIPSDGGWSLVSLVADSTLDGVLNYQSVTDEDGNALDYVGGMVKSFGGGWGDSLPYSAGVTGSMWVIANIEDTTSDVTGSLCLYQADAYSDPAGDFTDVCTTLTIAGTGEIDEDGDGHPADDDCDDTDPDYWDDCPVIEEGELCWTPQVEDVENCETRVDEKDVVDWTCNIQQALGDVELWNYADGWDDYPLATATTLDPAESICATATAVDGYLQVNLKFEGDVHGSDAEFPIDGSGSVPEGEWYGCANWYGTLSAAGLLSWDGYDMTSSTMTVESTGSGIDCFLVVDTWM